MYTTGIFVFFAQLQGFHNKDMNKITTKYIKLVFTNAEMIWFRMNTCQGRESTYESFI